MAAILLGPYEVGVLVLFAAILVFFIVARKRIKFARRVLYILWHIIAIIISGVSGIVVTALLGTILSLFGGGSRVTETSIGIAGGAIAGYIWGRIFSFISYNKYKKMMHEMGIDVIDAKNA